MNKYRYEFAATNLFCSVPGAEVPGRIAGDLAVMTQIDPQLPNANGRNPDLKLWSAVSQNLNWHTAAAKFKSASIRVS
jgi:hypothetical protein